MLNNIPILSIQLIILLATKATYATTPNFVDATGNIVGPGVEQANSGGIAWLDYDKDGWQDLYIVNVAGDNRLYRNLGDPDKNGVHNGFTRITNANIELSGSISNGATIADYNNDGWDDIFVSNTGVNSLLENQKNGTFIDVTVNQGLSGESTGSYAATFGDVDGDGDLDLYVVAWIGDNHFYRNNGGSSGFSLVTNNGLASSSFTFDAVMTDVDNDGDMDIYEANDFFETNKLWINNGAGNFSLKNSGAGISILGMGIAVGDYNRDGLLDLYSSSISAAQGTTVPDVNVLLQNTGAGNFSNVTQTKKVLGNERLAVISSVPLRLQCSVYWGASFLDVDNDGNLDLYAANDNRGFGSGGNGACHNQETGLATQNRLYMNNGAPNNFDFSERILSTVNIEPGQGVATADYDKDGRIDIAVHGRKGDVKLLRNTSDTTGNSWLGVELVGNGTTDNADGIGAKVIATSTSSTGTITQVRELRVGGGHGSTDSNVLHFGFTAGSTIDEVRVEWPNGSQPQIIGSVTKNGILKVTEPQDGAIPLLFQANPAVAEQGAGGIFISGNNLCAYQCNTVSSTETRVLINGKTITPDGVGPTWIFFTLPNDIPTGPGSLVVEVNGIKSAGIPFTVAPPSLRITAVQLTMQRNVFATISGMNLCLDQCGQVSPTETFVMINGTQQTVSWMSETMIVFQVSNDTPLGSSSTGAIVINPYGTAWLPYATEVLP